VIKTRKAFVLFFIVVLLINISVIAQTKKICGKVYYTQVKNLTGTYSENYLLTFNNEQSFSEEINIKNSKSSQDKNYSGQDLTHNVIAGRNNLTSKFFFNTKANFYFRDNFFDQILVVKEDQYNLKWNILQEIKKIGGFSCQKATTKFRGRTYIAWFTSDIPVPFGPWKFKGLAGLILEVYDVDKVFHIVANNVKIGEKIDCTIAIDKNQLKSAMTIPVYLVKKEALINAEFVKMSSRMPKGFGTLKWDKNCDDCGGEIEKF